MFSESESKNLYIYIGGGGVNRVYTSGDGTVTGGYNGGANSYLYNTGCYRQYSSSGGATDIRTTNGNWNNADSLRSRIIVSGAGAGVSSNNCSSSDRWLNNGAAGGGLIGGIPNSFYPINNAVPCNYGGTQISGGEGRPSWSNSSVCSNSQYIGQFGYGATGKTGYTGGGGGWYGGASGEWSSGGGGSSYISGHTGCVGVTSTESSSPKSGCTTSTTDNSCSISPYGYTFINTVMIDGNGYQWYDQKGTQTRMPNPTSDTKYALGVGHSGNGYARVTRLADNYTPTFKVKLQINGGTLSKTSVSLANGESSTATFTADTGYTTTGATVSCTSDASGSISGTTLTISNVTDNAECTVNNVPNTYTVTFDANGGTVTTSSKTVTYTGTYGDLPTPTREGYTFKGWNGKNKFDYQNIVIKNSSTVNQSTLNGIQTINWINGVNATNQRMLKGYFKENARYIISGRIASSIKDWGYFCIVYTDGTNNCRNFGSDFVEASKFYDFTMTSQSGKTIDYLRGIHSNGETMYLDITSTQIEEGTTATAYEPYYITSSTEVVQPNNHTLTAIWEANTYTVTLDANGGSVDTNSKTVTYGSTYGTLPTPTRSGYTFKGWSRLPDGYQEIEYLQSSGTQKIDSGVAGNSDNLRIDIKYANVTLPASGNYVAIFGSYVDEDTNVTRLIYHGTSTTYFNINSKAALSGSLLNTSRTVNTIYDESLWRVGDTIYYKTNAASGITSRNLEANGSSNSNKIHIFAHKTSGDIGSSIKLYNMKIHNNGTLIRNFIPSYRVSDGVAGLYDRVNGAFYTNSGSGTFTKGNDKYVSSTSEVMQPNNHTLTAIWEYNEPLLNGADPVLDDDLIPVTLSSTNSDWTVTYADTSQQWYKYGESKWANAVRLKSSPSKTYAVGDTISHSDIAAYFVWIPRYKYKLFDMGNYSSTVSSVTAKNQLIDIVFGTDTTTDTSTSCATPMTSGASGNCAVNKYMTHPAFISFDSNGFWVGKFETGGNLSTSNNVTTISSISVLPGIISIRNVNVENMFTNAYSYNRILDSHMMKNTEWAAVAYLSHSSYGMGNKNIYVNNYYDTSSQRISGCVGDGPSVSTSTACVNQWYSTTGLNGSTTGNITGIYDMSGGAVEIVSAYKSGSVGSSGFTTATINSYDSKYFDIYHSDSTATSWNKRILGDATGELGTFMLSNDMYISSWYGDYGNFDASTNWFTRGGGSGGNTMSGLFAFSNYTGVGGSPYSFRLVLTP